VIFCGALRLNLNRLLQGFEHTFGDRYDAWALSRFEDVWLQQGIGSSAAPVSSGGGH